MWAKDDAVAVQSAPGPQQLEGIRLGKDWAAASSPSAKLLLPLIDRGIHVNLSS